MCLATMFFVFFEKLCVSVGKMQSGFFVEIIFVKSNFSVSFAVWI